jgi:hypothetical protein
VGDLPADAALQQELEAELRRLTSLAPLQVLGLGAGADAAAIRASFLALTKRLHPSRFARRPQPIVKLANEIFLRVRDAYERASAAGDGRAPKQSDPPLERGTPTPTRPPGQPIANPIAAAARPVGPPIAPPVAVAVATRPPGQPVAMPPSAAAPSAAAPTPSAQVPSAPLPASSVTPPTRPPGQPSDIDGDLRAAITEKRRRTAAAGVPVVTTPRRSTGDPPIAAGGSGNVAGPSGGTAAAPRSSSGNAPLTDGVPSGTRVERMRRAELMMAQGQLAEARIALRALAADQPDDSRAKALLHFVAGREHLLAERRAEARIELERALAAEPSLHEASDLLASIDKKDGGLFSRWFRK